MIQARFWIAALAVVWLVLPAKAEPGPKEDARALAAKIDQFIAARWQAEKVTPAPLADDGAFLRRLSLDVIGRIPLVSETRRFLRDPASDKREQAIERLLDSPGYVSNFSNIWRDLLMPEANADFQQRFLSRPDRALAAQAVRRQRLLRSHGARAAHPADAQQSPGDVPIGRSRGNRRRWRFTNPNRASRRTWRRARPGCFSASAWNAPSATIIRLAAGRASSSGARPRFSAAFARRDKTAFFRR